MTLERPRKKPLTVRETFMAKKRTSKAKRAPKRNAAPKAAPAPASEPKRPAAVLVPLATVAAWLNLTERRVQQLADEGVVIREGRGRYDLQASVSAYVSWLQQAKAASLPGGGGGATGDAALELEKLRRTRAQADQLELKNAEAQGKMIPVEAVTREWADVLRMVRAGVMAIPTRMGAKLPHLTAHDLDQLDRELRRALTDLGNDPSPEASARDGSEKPDPAPAAAAVQLDRADNPAA